MLREFAPQLRDFPLRQIVTAKTIDETRLMVSLIDGLSCC